MGLLGDPQGSLNKSLAPVRAGSYQPLAALFSSLAGAHIQAMERGDSHPVPPTRAVPQSPARGADIEGAQKEDIWLNR